MDVDVDGLIERSSKALQTQSLQAALELLGPAEKQARTDADLETSTKLLEHIMNLCATSGDWKILNGQLIVLAKKRGQLKQSVAAMVQRAITFIEPQSDMTKKLQLIETLRQVTLGKIFVEVERAKLTKMLSLIKEKEGNLKEAADILFDLQVETFGSMAVGERLDFLLDQMRLGLLLEDFTRTQIISRKINVKFFEDGDTAMDIRKVNYYEMMIQLALHDKKYLACSNYYLHLYDIKSIEERQMEILKFVVLFVALSPFDNEQSDLMNRVLKMKLLESIPLYKNFLLGFAENEIMRWPLVEQMYFGELSSAFVFSPESSQGKARWQALKDRVIEHNIRAISGYYSHIGLNRLSSLLDIDSASAEEALSKLVVAKTIYARLDRPSGLITFEGQKKPEDVLDAWSDQIKGLLDQVVKVNHLVAKEEMLHSMQSRA